MVRDELSLLAAFLTVAKQRSFTRAAKRLGVSPSALSHAVKGLEEQIGIRLLSRTTRSVAPTDAGEQLIARLDPALTDIREALGLVAGLRNRPAGRMRLVVSPLAATMVLAPKLGAFAHTYPDVILDVTTTNEERLDLVAGHFDAGIHLGEFIERDMIAVRASADQRAAIVGAPTYFAAHPKPKSPRDLTKHRCLNFRHLEDETYRWEFDKGKQSLAVAVDGPLVVDDVQLLIRAAIDGVGLTFLMEEHAAPYPREPATSACARRLVRAVCRLLSLLSEPAPAAGRADSADRDLAPVERRATRRHYRARNSSALGTKSA